MKKIAIIVAGGTGSRMNAPLPKQFLLLAGEPLLFHTLRKFENAVDHIILVMHADWISYWNNTILEHQFKVAHSLVVGGTSRAQSVLNGLNTIHEECLIAIHDAARPGASKDLIEATFLNAEKYGACIPVCELKESIRELLPDGTSRAVDRSHFRNVQTPQTFKSAVLKSAFQNSNYEKYTDDASLVESTGQPIFLIAGEEQNIKVTTASDLQLIEKFI